MADSLGTLALLVVPVLLAGFSVAARAQCTHPALPALGFAGADGPITAMAMWDPDGPGPTDALAVLAGSLSVAGNLDLGPNPNLRPRIVGVDMNTETTVPISNALFEGAPGSGQPLINAFAALPNGRLVVGGRFGSVGGVPAANIAVWDGIAWNSLGGGPGGPVSKLAVGANGDLWVAGSFSLSSGGVANGLARWAGGSWSQIGGLGPFDSVGALAPLPGGGMLVGGRFAAIGGIAAANIARFDGVNWTALGSGSSTAISALVVLPNGDVVASTGYLVSGTQNLVAEVARFDGASWSPVGTAIPDWRILDLALLPNGDIAACGMPPPPPFAGSGIAAMRFDGFAWTSMGVGFGNGISRYSMAGMVVGPAGNILGAGAFLEADGLGMRNVGAWSGTIWRPLRQSPQLVISDLARLLDGRTLAAGSFGRMSPSFSRGIAAFDGATWQPVAGPGLPPVCLAVAVDGRLAAVLTDGAVTLDDGSGWQFLTAPQNAPASALAFAPSGELLVGGEFTIVGGQPANHLAAWNGSAWQSFGAGPPSPVRALVALPTGRIAVGCADRRVRQWDGATWSPPLGPPCTGNIDALSFLANGELVVGGEFQSAGGVQASYVARWNGTVWQAMGAGLPQPVRRFGRLPTGELLAVGGDNTSGYVSRWNGVAWTQLASCRGYVAGVVAHDDGVVDYGGAFVAASGAGVGYFARLVTTCLPTAAPSPSSCVSAPGVDALTAITLPWLGTRCQARLTAPSFGPLVLVVRGLATINTPLMQVVPQATPGCQLRVTPDLLDVALVVGGIAAIDLDVPNAPALLGRTVHQQAMPLQFDALGNLTGVSASNALALTFGGF